MTKRALPLALPLALLPLPSLAEAPRVITDIAPVHSLVAQVMKGVGTPELLTDQGTSPHHMQLRPSQARSLDQADLLVWVGPELTPWLDRALEGLTPAHSVPLLDLPATLNRAFGAQEEDHEEDHEDHAGDDHGAHDDHAGDDHDHGEEDHAEHDHGDHDHGEDEDHGAHDHEETHGDDEHAHEETGHDDHGHDDHGHSHDGLDPHAWLDPENGVIWLSAIAEELAEVDPGNAATYRANAASAAATLEQQLHELEHRLEAVEFPALVTAHDAYGHFAARYHLPLTGHVSLSDAASPSAGHIAELRETLAPLGTLCLFTEPQLDSVGTAAMLEGLDVVILELDPLGSRQEVGEALYGNLLGAMGDAFLTCVEKVK